jgi:hypothetical protein
LYLNKNIYRVKHKLIDALKIARKITKEKNWKKDVEDD